MIGNEAHLGQSIRMNDPTADAYIARDISKTVEEKSWRWAYRHPALHFYLNSTSDLKFMMDAGVTETTFKETGPVTLTIAINNHVLDQVRFDHPGNQHFEKPVPAELLKPGAENLVTIEADKQWVSKTDGAVLSFVLIEAGFKK